MSVGKTSESKASPASAASQEKTPVASTVEAARRVGGAETTKAGSKTESHDKVEVDQGSAHEHPMFAAMQSSFAADDAAPHDSAPRKTEVEATAETFLTHFDQLDSANNGKTDGIIARVDIERVAGDESAPPELREAARKVLGDENLLNIFDLGDGQHLDRKIGRGDLDKVIASERSAPQELSVNEVAARVRDNFSLLDTASGKGGRDGKISRGDLEKALTNPDLPAETRQAVEAVLNNQNYANALDLGSAHGGEKDGIIAVQDVNAAADRGYLKDPSLAADPHDNLEFQKATVTLATNFATLDTAAGGGKPDGRVSRKDIEAVLANPSTSPELRAAAKLLTDNPAFLNAVDVGAGRGEVDGELRQADLFGFVTVGLDRAKDNADKLNGQFERFVAQNGAYIDPARLDASPEAARLKSANAGLEAFAQNFADLYASPGFKESFAHFSDEEKAHTVEELSKVAGTQAGAPLADRVVDQVAVGQPASDPVAEFLLSPDGRRLERSSRTALNGSLNSLVASRVVRSTSAAQSVDTVENFIKNSQGPEALKDSETYLTKLRSYAGASDELTRLRASGASATEITQAEQQLAKLRGDVASTVKEASAPGVARGVQLLTVGALALDAHTLANHDFGTDLFKDVSLVSGTVQDALILNGVRSGVARGATSLLGARAGSLVGTRAVPFLGAIASFTSAISAFKSGDKVGAGADALTGIGFSVIAATGASGYGAIAGGILVGVGSAIRVGEVVYEALHESEQDKTEKDFNNFSRQVLSEVYAGDPRRASDLAGLSDKARQQIQDYAKMSGLDTRQAYEMLRGQALQSDSQDVNAYLVSLYELAHPPQPETYVG